MKKDCIYYLFYGNSSIAFTRFEKALLDSWIERLKNFGVDFKVYKQLDLF